MLIKYNNFLLKTYIDGVMVDFCFTPHKLAIYIYNGQKLKCITIYMYNNILNHIKYERQPNNLFSVFHKKEIYEYLEIKIDRKKYYRFIEILEKYLL